MMLKCYTQYVSKFGKISRNHRTGKGQFSFQSQRRAVSKNVQTIHPQYVNQEFPDIQAGFRKGRVTRDQITNIRWIIEKAREFQKNIYFCFIDYAKALTMWITTNCENFLKRMGITDNLTCLLRNLQVSQEAIVRSGHGTTDWFQIGKGVHQGCILSIYYLTYMQSTSFKMAGWMNHTLESRLLREILTVPDMQMIPF